MGRKPSGAIRTDKVIQKQKNGDRYVYERQSKYSPEKGYYVSISSICLGKMKRKRCKLCTFKNADMKVIL